MLTPFQFKQFSIAQDLCAMKVGTDGVLLGAWSKVPNGNVLDIGSGSGLISLMVAQRNKNCTIDAIDIDQQAYLQTLNNIKNCPWNDRIKGHHTALQCFHPSSKYNLIISNPPFFINAFKAENESKNRARHTDELSYQDFIHCATQLLQPSGILSVVLPVKEAEFFNDIAHQNKLYINRKCWVKPNSSKAPKRVLLEFRFHPKVVITEYLTIERDQRHDYTEEYRNLTQDFYLKF